MNDKEYKEIIKNNRSFSKLINVAIKRHFFKWPFWTSLTLTLFSLICLLNKNKKIYSNFTNFLKNQSMNFFSLSVSSMAIILTALAIILVTYKPGQIKAFLIATICPSATPDTKDTFKGFVSPYILGILAWELVAFLSLLYKILSMFNLPYMFGLPILMISVSIIYIFFIIYSIIFLIYLVLEIIEHIILSSYYS